MPPPENKTFRRSVDVFIRGQHLPVAVLLETVGVLEPSLAQLVAHNRTDADIVAPREARRKLGATRTPAAFVSINAAWHDVIGQASHNPILITVYDVFGTDLLDPRVEGSPRRRSATP